MDIKKSSEIRDTLFKNQNESKESIQKFLTDIYNDSKEVFETIDYFKYEFMKKETRSIDFYYNAEDQLTGCFMYLSDIVGPIEALVVNRSGHYFTQNRLEFEKNPPMSTNAKGEKIKEKFVTAPVEKEASDYVSFERYMLAVFTGLFEACRMGIQTCRSKMKIQNEEFGMNK